MSEPIYTTSVTKQHTAFILAVDKTFFENTTVVAEQGIISAFAQPINPYPHQLFLELAQSYLVIREREYLDNSVTGHASRAKADGAFKKGDPRYKQVLPYLVVRQRQEDGTILYFPYRRTKKVGESRLAGNGSIGYGGHVDLADICMTNSAIMLKETIIGSLVREADEEFVIRDQDGLSRTAVPSWFTFQDLFILDNSNEVGELHVGVVIAMDLPAGYTIKTVEDELATMPPMTAEQALDDPTFKPENWTRLYLEYTTKRPEQQKTTTTLDHGGETVAEVDPALVDQLTQPTREEALQKTLEENGLTVRGIFPGSDPNVTREQVAGEIHRSVEQLLGGLNQGEPELAHSEILTAERAAELKYHNSYVKEGNLHSLIKTSELKFPGLPEPDDHLVTEHGNFSLWSQTTLCGKYTQSLHNAFAEYFKPLFEGEAAVSQINWPAFPATPEADVAVEDVAYYRDSTMLNYGATMWGLYWTHAMSLKVGMKDEGEPEAEAKT